MLAVTWRREKDEALWVMGSKVNTSIMAWRIRTMGSASFVLNVCWWFQLGLCTLKEDRVGYILKVDIIVKLLHVKLPVSLPGFCIEYSWKFIQFSPGILLALASEVFFSLQ